MWPQPQTTDDVGHSAVSMPSVMLDSFNHPDCPQQKDCDSIVAALAGDMCLHVTVLVKSPFGQLYAERTLIIVASTRWHSGNDAMGQSQSTGGGQAPTTMSDVELSLL